MIAFIVALIGVVIFWKLVAHGFGLGTRATAATERTSAILEAALPPEKWERVREIESRREDERAAEDLAYRRRRAVFLWVLIIGGFYLAAQVSKANAQGIYMGRDGRAHASVIVGADGAVFPVAPTFCTPGLGPCPVVFGPPVGPYAPPPPITSYAPSLPAAEAPPPIPLGWVFTRYTVCPEPRSCPIVFVSVDAEGLNVRPNGPDGPPSMALLNGTPLVVVARQGSWMLVAPACDLVPTGAFVWTSGVSLNRCS